MPRESSSSLSWAYGIQSRSKVYGVRVICFFLCIPSVGALLAKVYGLASMQAVALAVALPCSLGLVGVWVWARRSARELLASALAIGFTGGLLGTIAYDLIRIPFHVAGMRVFVPISAYGVWIAGADSSSRFTEAIGWLYHFSNGITFGIMYALFMANRHWAWAILWAFVLETIAVLSPFAQIFRLSGNYYALGIAYLGHVAYGLPLGRLVHRWNDTLTWLANVPKLLQWPAMIFVAAALLGPLASPESAQRDKRAAQGEFRVEGYRLNPDWLRIERSGQILVFNPEPEAVSVLVKENSLTGRIPAGQKATFSFPKTGIYQIFVKTERQSRSSFVIVEPVEELK